MSVKVKTLACLLGLSDRVRTFKRIANGRIPVYEEI